jgi:hypothetical protein
MNQENLVKKLVSVAALVALSGALAAPASAADSPRADRDAPQTRGTVCFPVYEDSSGQEWDLDAEYGSVDSGSNGAYDGYGRTYVEDPNSDAYADYRNAGQSCTFEEGGRELVLPSLVLEPSGEVYRGEAQPLLMQRKIYVPSSGLPFARFLNILRNTSSEPITLRYGWYGWYGCAGDANGEDGGIDTGDRGIVVEHCKGGNAVTSLFAGPGARTWDDWYDLPDDGSMVDIVWSDVTIPAGGTVTFMHIEHQNGDVDGAVDFAVEHGDGAEQFFAGLSQEERAALVNWRGVDTPPADSDTDGITDDRDNCVAAANASQADLDRDGRGDACDDDADGDGLSAAVETGLGTNALSGDSDGDGRSDGTDLCPTLAGPGAGCPAPATTLASTGLVLPDGVTLNVTARRGGASASGAKARAAQAGGVTVRATGRIRLPRGLGANSCDDGRVAVVIKRGKRTISTRVVPVGDDCTYRSTVRFNRRLGKSVRVKSYFFGSRALRGRAAKSKVATIK